MASDSSFALSPQLSRVFLSSDLEISPPVILDPNPHIYQLHFLCVLKWPHS